MEHVSNLCRVIYLQNKLSDIFPINFLNNKKYFIR